MELQPPTLRSASRAGPAAQQRCRVQPAQRPCSQTLRQRPLQAAATPPTAAQAAAAGGGDQPPAAAAAAQTVPITFVLGGDEITVDAQPGQNLWDVASAAGADITLGCRCSCVEGGERPRLEPPCKWLLPSCSSPPPEPLPPPVPHPSSCSQGSCGVCEVEVWRYSGGGGVPSTGVARACVARVPPGYARIEVHEMPDDAIWGVDGYDT